MRHERHKRHMDALSLEEPHQGARQDLDHFVVFIDYHNLRLCWHVVKRHLRRTVTAGVGADASGELEGR